MKPSLKNLLSISWDKNLVSPQIGNAINRQKTYAKFFNHTTIIVLTSKADLVGYSSSKLTIIPTNSPNSLASMLDAILIARHLHHLRPFHLVTADDPIGTGLTAILIKWLLHLPFNLQLHINYIFEPAWITERWQNLFFTPLIGWQLFQADSIRVVNHQLKAKLDHLFDKSRKLIFWAPVYADLKFYYRPINTRHKITRLVSVGRLVKQKNFPLLINAFAKSLKTNHNLHLTIIGIGPEYSHLKSQIHQLGLTKQVSLVGGLPPLKIRHIFCHSDIFVLASNYEGWGMVYLEALSAGLPVITTKVSSTNEIIQTDVTGLISEVSTTSLAQTINKLTSNPQLAHQLATNGQQFVLSHFSSKSIIKLWINGLNQT